MLSPSWLSSLEDAFLWIGGTKLMPKMHRIFHPTTQSSQSNSIATLLQGTEESKRCRKPVVAAGHGDPFC
ncbi:hypothetical protein FF2_017059 [Malus domestica]